MRLTALHCTMFCAVMVNGLVGCIAGPKDDEAAATSSDDEEEPPPAQLPNDIQGIRLLNCEAFEPVGDSEQENVEVGCAFEGDDGKFGGPVDEITADIHNKDGSTQTLTIEQADERTRWHFIFSISRNDLAHLDKVKAQLVSDGNVREMEGVVKLTLHQLANVSFEHGSLGGTLEVGIRQQKSVEVTILFAGRDDLTQVAARIVARSELPSYLTIDGSPFVAGEVCNDTGDDDFISKGCHFALNFTPTQARLFPEKELSFSYDDGLRIQELVLGYELRGILSASHIFGQTPAEGAEFFTETTMSSPIAAIMTDTLLYVLEENRIFSKALSSKEIACPGTDSFEGRCLEGGSEDPHSLASAKGMSLTQNKIIALRDGGGNAELSYPFDGGASHVIGSITDARGIFSTDDYVYISNASDDILRFSVGDLGGSSEAFATELDLVSARGLFFSDEINVVADTINHEVLIWKDADPRSSNPDITLTELAGTTSFLNPKTVLVHDGMLFVADTSHFRILIWNSIPVSNEAPSFVLGQSDICTTTMDEDSVSRGDRVQEIESFSLFESETDPALVIPDKTNNRVLIVPIPTDWGPPDETLRDCN